MGMNLNYLATLLGQTPSVAGTAAANSPIVLGASKDIATITSATITTMTGNTVGQHSGTWRITRNAPVAATGTNLATAAQLAEGFTVVTGADGTVGVKLPATPVAGSIVIIKGTTAAVLKVYPDAAATINAIGANGAMSLASGVIPAIFIADSTTQWYTIPLLPS